MNDETRGAVLRLAAEVVRAACGLDDEESPELDMSAETARIMAMRAKDEIDATRAAFAAEAALREALEGQLRDTERERDEALRTVDALRRDASLGRAVREALGADGARAIWYAIHVVGELRDASIREHGGSVGSAMVTRSCEGNIEALTRVADAVAKDREVAR